MNALNADTEQALHECGSKLLTWGDLPRADAIVAAAAHRKYQGPCQADLGRKLANHTAITDVKDAFDAQAQEAAGYKAWHL